MSIIGLPFVFGNDMACQKLFLFVKVHVRAEFSELHEKWIESIRVSEFCFCILYEMS